MTEHELIDYGLSIGWLTPEKAEELREKFPEIVRCKDCKKRGTINCPVCMATEREMYADWFCADGERKDGEQDV